jgi:hypothetical protein
VKEPSLHLTIVISGWLSQEDDFSQTWSKLLSYSSIGRVFGLRWESGSKFRTLTEDLPNIGLSVASLWKANPFFIGLQGFRIINTNPFKLAAIKAEKTGIALAHFLAQRVFAGTCVSLVGFSLGTRVIYYCLKELAEIAPGLIHNAFLMGGTVSSSAEDWVKCRRGVAGRLVNVSTDSDYVLKYFYRLAKLENPIGVNAVEVEGIENYDLTGTINGHTDYREKLDEILSKVYFQP